MRKLILLVALALPFVIPPSAHAAVQVNEIQPLNDFEVSIPCTGEAVTLNGSIHVLVTFTINDNRVAGTEHFQPIHLVGEDTAGRTYHGVGITSDHFSASLHGFQFTATSRNNFFIIGTRGAPSYKLHEVFHATIDTHGRFVSLQEHFWITCQ